jgi:hypothetical protein
MTTEQYSIGYDDGYQDGVNKETPWKYLTEADIQKCIPSAMFNGDLHATTFALEIEAILKEKNT